jgi:hypothetical protein
VKDCRSFVLVCRQKTHQGQMATGSETSHTEF